MTADINSAAFGVLQMQKVLGYLLTWTTYGSWLQGDKRKYVKNGQILPPNPSLEKSNKQNMLFPQVSLTHTQREIITKAILAESEELDQQIFAISIRKNHVHLAADCNFISPRAAVSHYKNAARLAMQTSGFTGRLWTKGFSVRYCFNPEQLNAIIAYVKNHNIQTP